MPVVFSKRYAFEAEVPVRALWAGFGLKEVDVSVEYPKDRISHFSLLKDNFRLSVLNTYLTIRSMLPIPHRQYGPSGKTGKSPSAGIGK